MVNTLTIWLAILLLLIYIKMYLLLSDTSTTEKELQVLVHFHSVVLSVPFVTQQCQLLQ